MVVDNAARVDACYWGVLGRAPDTEGFRFWVAKLDEGLGEEQLIRLFLNGAERQHAHPADESASAFIDGCYGDLLGRSADADGKAFWLGRLETLGSTHQDARAAVIAEMIDYLGRPDGQSADQQLFQTRLEQWEPLTPGLVLHEDTGMSATDGITRNGQVDVTLPDGVTAWSYSLDGGQHWTLTSADSHTLQLGAGYYQADQLQVSYLGDDGNARTLANQAPWRIDTQGAELHLFTTRGPTTENLLQFRFFDDGDIEQWRSSSDGGQTWQQGEGRWPAPKLEPGFYAQGSILVETTDTAGNVAVTALPRDLTVLPADLTPPRLTGIDQQSYYNPYADDFISLLFDDSIYRGTRDLYSEAYPIPVKVDPTLLEKAFLLDVTTGAKIGFEMATPVRQLTNLLDIRLTSELEEGHQYSVYLPGAFVYDGYNNPSDELTLLGASNTFIAA
ncbi:MULTISPECIES: DUF4214 domain-containing protein [unclassified Pseudomonas]|uniref:DUF4214 domain-containing protein n=1 Tax=unclassified Pseudomonas TaxID=196821 RepID=UPI00235F3A2F|nr:MULTISPECIES: DUF4214 domain-containing protein [unclassified Pseudomonas]